MPINILPTATSIGAVPISRLVSAGTNMTGGGALSADIILNSNGGGGVSSGTSFPGSPSNNDLFYRTDRDILYFYDSSSSQWLSVNLYDLAIPFQEATYPLTGVTGGLQANSPFYNEYAIYVLYTNLVGYNTLATNTNYYSGQYKYWVGNTSTNIGSAISMQNDTQNSFVSHKTAINSSIPSTSQAISISFSRTGVPSVYMSASLSYRLIG